MGEGRLSKYFVLSYFYKGVCVRGYINGFYKSNGPVEFAREFCPGLKEYTLVDSVEMVSIGSFLEIVDEWGKEYVIQLSLEREENGTDEGLTKVKHLYAVSSHKINGFEQILKPVLVYANTAEEAVLVYSELSADEVEVVKTDHTNNSGCFLAVKQMFDFLPHSVTRRQLNKKALAGKEYYQLYIKRKR